MIGEMIYCLIVHTLVIQFKYILTKCFSFHQFNVTTCNWCELVIHGVRTMLDLHPY
jgi:hypothetical protein